MSHISSFNISTEPTIRGNLYKLFSLGFRYPTPEVFKTFQDGKYLTKVWDNINLLPHLKTIQDKRSELTGIIQNSLAGISFEAFAAECIRIFDLGTPEPHCPPYEGFYRSESRAALMLTISAFYRRFSLTMSKKEGKRELPDYLCAELEFLHFLTFKEAQAGIDGNPEFLRGYLLAQKDFLERHMIQWIPKFCDALQNSANVPFYVLIARTVFMFITCELELVSSCIGISNFSATALHTPNPLSRGD
ncbi:MAG: molecular chaperone TorD family protein [Candidatus Brocadia sp.]|nr:molecular chaperone TorD family protein [Candidatus Brocadia sp.]